MAKTYWVMKTPGSTAEWLEMDGIQFYDFITSPTGKGRYFMDCDTYEIEVSPEQYRQWKCETNHSNYLKSFEDEVMILSLESLAEDIGISGSELIADSDDSVEDAVIKEIESQQLKEALLSLTADERWLIEELILRDKPKTEQEIAELKGVSQQAIHKQKNKIIKKLKLLVVKS